MDNHRKSLTLALTLLTIISTGGCETLSRITCTYENNQEMIKRVLEENESGKIQTKNE